MNYTILKPNKLRHKLRKQKNNHQQTLERGQGKTIRHNQKSTALLTDGGPKVI